MSRKKIESKTVIGKRIRDIRSKRNMTQIELAKKSGVGLSRLKMYENGDSIPSVDAVINIASALDYSMLAMCEDSEFDKNTMNQLFDTMVRSEVSEKLDQSVAEILAIFDYPNVAEFINNLHKYNGSKIVRKMYRIQNMMERIENTEKHGGNGKPYLPDDAYSVRIPTEEWFEYYGVQLGHEIAKGITLWAMDKFNIPDSTSDLLGLNEENAPTIPDQGE